jgi:RNA polymerase sigma-70 factor (ECF subfamily)
MRFELSHETLLIEDEESIEKAHRLSIALQKLSRRQKEIIYLKYYQELSYAEVCDIMDINYQIARNLLYQSIKVLKKIMAPPVP